MGSEMNKIVAYLSTQEEELKLRIEFLNKTIDRLRTQIKDNKKSITAAKKTIDNTYNLFSASQSNNEVDTEIDTFNSIITDKERQISELEKEKEELNLKLSELSALGYSDENNEIFADKSDIIKKLKQIRKFMGVDNHRAKQELDLLISRLNEEE